MVMISSDEGYPKNNELLVRLEYFAESPPQGGILIIGKDKQRREYRSKKEITRSSSITLPSGTNHSVPVDNDPKKNYPALYFTFTLDKYISYPEILEVDGFNDDFFRQFTFTLFDENMKVISLLDNVVERTFKEIIVWGPYELGGLPRNHFWGEMYRERTSEMGKFLERFRNKDD